MEKKTIKINTGFCGWLALAFIVLKLCGVIDWAWIWVLAPLWVGWGLALLICGVVFLGAWIYDRFM